MATRKSELVLTCNATAIKDVMEFLNQKMNDLIKKRDELNARGAKEGWTKDMEKEFKNLGDDIAAITSMQQKNREEMMKYAQVMENLSNAKLRDLKSAAAEASRALNKMTENDPNRRKLIEDIEKIKRKIKEVQTVTLSEAEITDRVNNKKKYNIVQLQQAYDQLKAKLSNIAVGETEAIEKTQKQMKSLQKEISTAKGELTGFAKLWNTALKNIGAYMGVFAAFGYARNLIKGMVTESLNLSDAFAQVQKVTGFSAEEVKKLNGNLSKLDTRTSLAQLNELAFTAGKMGLGKYQLEGVQGFVKAANELQVALGEDLGSSVEEAILPLAKLGENLGLFEKLGVEKAMKAIGSSINELSQTTTAAGSNIVDFARRIQPSAQMVGLTADEILALGSAADSFGLHAEVAATSFTKFLVNYRTNTEAIEQALGITKGTLDEMFARGDTMQGLMLIFQRMHDLGDLRVLAPIFKELGSEGSRMSETFGSFAVNIDQLREHLNISTKAFEEATSVTREYNLVQETAQGIMERSTNIWKNAFVNPEGVDMVKQLADEWYRLSRELTESSTWMTAAKNSLGLILEAVKLLIEALPTLIRLMMFYGVGNVLQNLILNFNNIYRAVILAGNGVQRFNLLLKTNAIAIGVTLLGYVVTKFIDIASAADKAAESVEENNAAMDRSQRATQTYTSTMASNYATLMEKYDQLKRQWKALKTEHEKNEWIKKNKSAFEELGLSVTNAASAEDVFEKNTARVVEGFKRRAEAAALAAQMTELYRQQMDIQGEAQKKINEKGVSEGDRVLSNPTGRYERDKNANTFNNGQYTLGNDGSYHYTEKGAEEYNRQLVNGYITEYESIGKKIDDAAKRMEELGKTPATTNVTPKGDDKGGNTRAAKKEAQERKQALRKEMEDAQKESTAVINAIEEFYRLQESAVEQLVADGKMTREEADRALNYVKNRKDLMLMNARRAIAGKDSDFEELRKTMGKDMLRPNDVNSQRALNTVQTIDVQQAAKNLQKFDGSKAVYDLNAGSFTQAMLKNAAQNELNIQRRQAAVQTEIDKILMQYQFVEQAQRTFGDKLVKLGLITDGYDKVVQQLADGTEVVANTKDVQALADKTVKMDARKMYGVDTDDAQELRNMVDALMHTVDEDGNKIRESFASMFPNLDEWLANPEQYKEQMQAFYKALIDMDTDYYKALKQNYEQESREFKERWQAMGWTDQEERENTAFETQDSLRKIQGEGENFGQTYGFADTIADDPEIARIKNRMEWRAKELEDLQARNASEELIMQKQNEMLKEAASLAEKVSSEVSERIGKIKELSEPLNSFGEEVGTMLGEQWQGISREGKLTFGQMVKNMGIEYAKLTLKMASENLMKKLQQSLFYKQMEMEEMQHQVQLTNIAIQGANTRQQAQAGIGQLGLITKSAQDTAEIGAEGGKATIMTMFGISEGAAKTIAKLGFWGIPLIGVITAILMGLLNSAKSTASQASETATSTATNPSAAASNMTSKLRLGKGMLTYDEGNVHKYLGEDGRVYTATEEPAPKDGLVTHPIATTVQGQAALVAEKGPEIVLGRKTTRAIMMNEPELIRYLANYQQHGGKYEPRKVYDAGNIDGITESRNNDTTAGSNNEALMQRLDKSDELMASVLFYLQHPVRPKIEMFSNGGEDGMYESMQKATSFMRRYGK